MNTMTEAHNFAPLSENGRKLAPLIDHTQLKPDAPRSAIVKLCAEARFYGFASVCIHPCMVKLAVAELCGSGVKVCTVAGFPLGAGTSEAKSFETADAVQNGAQEIDMVMNISALKSGDPEYVREDIRSIVRTARKKLVKVILETCLLTDEEKALACRLAVTAGAAFVKTSTGLACGGATVEDVRLLRRTVGPDFGVKASGSIKTTADALRMVEAGANRLGTSASVAIVTG